MKRSSWKFFGLSWGDMFAVEHHPEPEVPLGDVEVMEEAGHVRGHGQPLLARGGELLEGQPVPVAELDGIVTASDSRPRLIPQPRQKEDLGSPDLSTSVNGRSRILRPANQ